MLVEVLGFTNLLCAGMLAGEEFVIRYGVRAPVASLDPQPEIQLRQALIRRLRVLVPWRAMINRWQRLDPARTWVAVAAFGLFLAAGALR